MVRFRNHWEVEMSNETKTQLEEFRRIIRDAHAETLKDLSAAIASETDAREVAVEQFREKAEAEAFGARFHRLLLAAMKSGSTNVVDMLGAAMDAAGVGAPCPETNVAGARCRMKKHQGLHDFGPGPGEPEPDDYVPQFATREEAEQGMRDLSGLNSVVRGEDALKSGENLRAFAKGIPPAPAPVIFNCAERAEPHIHVSFSEKSEPAPPAKKEGHTFCSGLGRELAARQDERAKLADRLATILPPGQRPSTWGLDDALEEVERRLNEKPGPVVSAIRDAALEEAAAKGDLYASRYDADHAYPEGRAHSKAGRTIAEGIRALKSKPAPQPSGNPGEFE